jgi:hypothetical protein
MALTVWPQMAPTDRHPVQLAAPVFINSALTLVEGVLSVPLGDGQVPITFDRLSPLQGLDAVTVAKSDRLWGLVRFDGGAWSFQPLAAQAKGAKTPLWPLGGHRRREEDLRTPESLTSAPASCSARSLRGAPMDERAAKNRRQVLSWWSLASALSEDGPPKELSKLAPEIAGEVEIPPLLLDRRPSVNDLLRRDKGLREDYERLERVLNPPQPAESAEAEEGEEEGDTKANRPVSTRHELRRELRRGRARRAGAAPVDDALRQDAAERVLAGHGRVPGLGEAVQRLATGRQPL